LVREYHASGLTQAEFARREGVKYPTFAHWVQRARKEEVPGKPVVQFAQVQLPTAPALPTPLEVRLPDGTIVRGNQAKDLAQLVRALRG
jgi:transposase-like protein